MTDLEKNETDQIVDKPDLEKGLSAIKSYLKNAPLKPGVYRMIDWNGDVLYVGKAKHIQRRVTSYTHPGRLTTRLIKMVSRTRVMEFVTTRTEAEALLLEASLIKRFQPWYNVLLKDDKSFPYILLRDHEWPQISNHRGTHRHKGKYYGPFASASSVSRTINILQKVFRLRNCTDATLESRTRPCLQYQIKRCSAPCVGRISAEDYAETVSEATAFLEGKSSHIQKKYADIMQKASTSLDYETAAVYRDRLQALTSIQSHQSMVKAMVDNADVIAAAELAGQVCVQAFFYRSGQNWGHRSYFPRHDSHEPVEAVLGAFLAQFYASRPAPKVILLSHMPPEAALLGEALAQKMEHKIDLQNPKRGRKADVVKEAVRNAVEALERHHAETASQRKLLEGVAKTLDLADVPQRIEVYDNSHIQGARAVGGMIVAGPEGFMKNRYRKFNIKDDDIEPGDDFAMMREVIRRRFVRLQKEDPNRDRGHWPDLVLIDGGKGQLSSVEQALSEAGITNAPIVAISKGPDRNAGREQFHIPGKQRFTLPPRDPVLYYLQRLRDEAHRFAIGSHRTRRSMDIKRSPLDTLPGVGPKRKKALLHHFGSAKAVIGADARDLEAVEGISKNLAEKIRNHFSEN